MNIGCGRVHSKRYAFLIDSYIIEILRKMILNKTVVFINCNKYKQYSYISHEEV